MMDKEKIIAALDAVSATRDILTDEQAAEVPDLFKPYEAGKGYEAGERIRAGDKLIKVLQDIPGGHPEWTPENAPSLFAEILPGQDGTDIGEWVQPDSTNPYMKGDKVTHNGKTWESIVEDTEDGKGRNTWEPGVYGWIEVA